MFCFKVTLKMRAAIALLVLLFSLCGAQTQSIQTEVQTESQSTGSAAAAAASAEASTLVDIYAELKELRDMVVEQRITLKSTQDELKIIEAENAAMKERLVVSETKVGALERVNEAQDEKLANVKSENAAQQAELAVVKTRLSASEAEVVNMKMETAALSTDLRSVAERLASTETDMEQVKEDTAAQHTDLDTLMSEVMNLTKQSDVTANEVEELKMENAAQEAVLIAVKTRLVAIETEVEDLEKAIRAAPKVAFSAALNEGYTEAGATSLNVVFGRVITNFGQAYSSVSGFFTAPVRGVYYFRFTVMDKLDSRIMLIHMHKNGQVVLGLAEYDSDENFSYLSSGVTLELEVGDEINLVLPADKRLYDDGFKHSTFSGFLLFPL